MLSQKIKKGFGLSEVSTLTPADASGPTVRSTDAGTHKIDGSTLKPFSMVQAIRSKRKTYLKVLPYRRRGFIEFRSMFSSKA